MVIKHVWSAWAAPGGVWRDGSEADGGLTVKLVSDCFDFSPSGDQRWCLHPGPGG